MRFAKAATLLALAATALPASASAGAGPYIPPGNSAANQYTESFPSPGGPVGVGDGLGGGKKKSPAEALGEETATALESQGPEGTAVAELAAESSAAPTRAPSSARKKRGHRSKVEDGKRRRRHPPAPAGSGPGAGRDLPTGIRTDVDGSSGAGQVLSKATLSSSGTAGIFLPLALLAALAWAILFAVRRRRGGLGST